MKKVKTPELPDFLEALGLRILGAILAGGYIFSVAFLGDLLDIEILNSSGG